MKLKQSLTYTIFVLLIFLILFNFWFLFTGAQPGIITSLNILFHEAGHWIFYIFGNFVYVLGGTLGEIIMPTIFIFHFWLRRDFAGMAFGYWWLSTAFYSISIYVADARAQVLPLIGGPGSHDWTYLLGRLCWLQYDLLIGKFFVILAFLATFALLWYTYRYWEVLQGKILS